MGENNQRKQEVLEILKKVSQDEIKFNKEENFKRAVHFAIDELEEFENELSIFLGRVQHLELYQEIIKEPLLTNMNKITTDLRYLIEKNYTKEEREKMPENVYNQVKKSQEKRIELLKKVAKRYLSKAKDQ